MTPEYHKALASMLKSTLRSKSWSRVLRLESKMFGTSRVEAWLMQQEKHHHITGVIGLDRTGDAVESDESRSIRPVAQPLCMVSQIQRSGGTLFAHLFDGHPQIHAHPPELAIGCPSKRHWVTLDLEAEPFEWFLSLYERATEAWSERGYSKQKNQESSNGVRFCFSPSLQWEIFRSCLGEGRVATRREILDAYMTSYFNAWTNNRNLGGEKKYVTSFAATFATNAPAVAAFFEDYPDGRLISVVREPRRWLASAMKHWPKHDPEALVRTWSDAATQLLENKAKYGERTLLLSFEDLVVRTTETMELVAEYLDIEFLEILSKPTLNGDPVASNSSYGMKGTGVKGEPALRDPRLGEELELLISKHALPVVEEVGPRLARV